VIDRRAHADVARTLEDLLRLLRRLAAPGELSLTAASTLALLARTGPRRLTELAVDEQVTQPAMTQLVARLGAQGLVERRSDPADGRVVNVAITDAGRSLVAARQQARTARLEEMLARLAPEDVDAIRAALPALRRLA
jgi:DNA-binding MarR family transcriptional regulator